MYKIWRAPQDNRKYKTHAKRKKKNNKNKMCFLFIKVFCLFVSHKMCTQNACERREKRRE